MRWWAPAAGVCWGWIGWGFLLRSCCVFLGENMSVQSGGSCVYLCDEKGAMREQKSQSSIYSEGGAGVSLALLSVVLFSSSSSDSSSREVPSTCSWRRPERLEEKLMGPPRLQEETVLIEFFFFFKWMSDSDFYLRRFFRVWTSRLRPSLASVASSSSRCSFLREALDRVASSSASSSWRFSCFIREFDFSTLKTKYQPNVRKCPDIY